VTSTFMNATLNAWILTPKDSYNYHRHLRYSNGDSTSSLHSQDYRPVDSLRLKMFSS